MKLEAVGEILKILKPFLKARTVFYISLILMVSSWIAFKFPEVSYFFGLTSWRINNEQLLGLATIV